MTEAPDREQLKAAQAQRAGYAQTERRLDVPVVVDETLCIIGLQDLHRVLPG